MIESSSQNQLSLRRMQSVQLSQAKSQAQRTEEEGGVIGDTFFGHLKSFIHYKDTLGQDKS